MDSNSKPSKDIIDTVLNRLKQQACNKICFDCSAKNPTWSSVTFGIFICIDCSAVHRNLGVHLTFVRSTNLDTNWTWLQLWQMELGGNANASRFFKQHDCPSTDLKGKYNSRIAHLYKEKLLAKSSQAMKNFGSQLDASITSTSSKKMLPTVDFLNSTVVMDISKTTLGNRKPVQKKQNLGMKKKSLGATKVATDFADIEKRANTVDRSSSQQYFQSDANDESSNLTEPLHKMTMKTDKKEDLITSTDPEKAKQLERLGMGVSFNSEITHSALTNMQTLDVANTKSLRSLERETSIRSLDFLDEDATTMYKPTKSETTFVAANEQDFIEPKITTMFAHMSNLHMNDKAIRSKTKAESCEDHTAQKKFGGAKCISSKQFFQGELPTADNGHYLTRFAGSNSISSADYFQNDPKQKMEYKSYGFNVSHHDMDDVKESVRQGVTKVAGRLSSLANDVISSLQEKYGY